MQADAAMIASANKYEEAGRLIDRIAASGVSAIVVHDGNGKTPRRVTPGE